MAPKNKVGHKSPEEHPIVIRNREQAKKQAEKTKKVYLRVNKNLRKQGKSETVSSLGYSTDIPGPLCHDISVEEILPPATSSDEEQELSHQIDRSKGYEKTKIDRTSVEEKSPVATQSEDRKKQKKIPENNRNKNNSLTGQSSSHSIPLNYSDGEKLYRDRQAEAQLGARKKTKPAEKMTVEEPLVPEKAITWTSTATQTELPMTQKKVKFPQRFKFKPVGTGQASSRNISQNFDFVAVKRDKTKTQDESRDQNSSGKLKANKTFTPRKTNKAAEFMRSDLQIIPVIEIKKLPVEGVGKKKLEKSVAGKGPFNEQAKQLAPLEFRTAAEKSKKLVSGFINVYASNESDRKDIDKCELGCIPNTNTTSLKIEDKNVKITIFVCDDGTQILCNIVKRSADRIDSSSRALEDQGAVKSEQDISSDPEHHNESPFESSNLSKVDISSGAYSDLHVVESSVRTLKGQATVKSDPEHYDETPVDSRNSINVGIPSETNTSSGSYLDLD